MVNRFSVATIKNNKNNNTTTCTLFYLNQNLSCFCCVGNGKYSLILIKVAEFIEKVYQMVLKMSSSKQCLMISKLLTDAQSHDTVIHQQFPKGDTEC